MMLVTENAATIAARAKRLYAGEQGLSPTLQTLRPYICPFEDLLPLVPQGARVLDVGCGAGLWLGLLADRGTIAHGTGFDTSDKAISLAQHMGGRVDAGKRLTFQRLDATAAWPAGDFDVISIIDVLHHVPPAHQLGVLTLAAKRLKPGGLLLYKDMAQRPAWKAMANRMHDLIVVREWINYVDIGTVDRHMTGLGMVAVTAGAASRYVYAHEWRLFKRRD
jgi:2-polyprenyl-3-methyl-5-hydroxy-6-metoxy-1,4-benzoquinol methylase